MIKAKVFKRLKKYFLEFFMIFMAVVLGFLAENFRENLSERNKEKEYVRWFIKDVQTDTVILHRNIKKCQSVITAVDSMILLLREDNVNSSKVVSFYTAIATSVFASDFHKSTMMQLKNSEHAGLIQSMRVHDLMARFEYGDLRKTGKEKLVDSQRDHIIDLGVQLFDNKSSGLFFDSSRPNSTIISDTRLLNQLIGRLIFYRYLVDDLLKEYKITRARFEVTINTIANEYLITKEEMDKIWNLALENASQKR